MRGREEVGEVDEVEVRAEQAERREDVGLRVAAEGREDDGSGGERGVRLIGRGRAPGDTRAAMSRAMEVLPDEGYPAMRVSLPRGMRLGHNQSWACWMKNAKGLSPASTAPVEV